MSRVPPPRPSLALTGAGDKTGAPGPASPAVCRRRCSWPAAGGASRL